jgi:addiction module HigA family antidote
LNNGSVPQQTEMKRKALPVHPGAILDRNLARCGVNAAKLAASLMVPVSHVVQIIRGDRSISADMACRLGRFFDNPPRYWLGLQNEYDLALVDRAEIERDVRPAHVDVLEK